MADRGSYALQLDETELGRYRMMAEQARATEADLWALAGIAPGAAVADVGCGPGAMLPTLSESVGATGSVHAIDGDPTAVAAATAVVAAAGLANTTVQAGRATATGLAEDAFDVVMMRHVLAHNGPSEQDIVDHLASLARPGGCVYLLDIDGDALRVRNADPSLDDLRSKYREFHALRGNDLQPGLRLPDLLGAAGLETLAYRGWYSIVEPTGGMRPPVWAAREAMLAAGVLTEDDIARWQAGFERTEARQGQPGVPPVRWFAPLFAAVGRRPA